MDEFQLTAQVTEYVPFFDADRNVTYVGAGEPDSGAFMFVPDLGGDPAVADGLVGIADAPPPVETVPGDMNDEQSAIMAALATGASEETDPAFANPDGTVNMDLWFSTFQLENDLANNGIAPEDYLSTAHDWMLHIA